MAPVVTVIGLGPAGPELITAESQALLASQAHVWLRTSRHPAAATIQSAGSFDHLYERFDTFEEVYRAIVEHLVDQATLHGSVLYAVPGSPMVAEHTVELLRADPRIVLDARSALGFTDLCWNALGIDPMAHAVTIVDAHRINIDSAGRLGPLLVTQVHSNDVLDDVILALDDVAPATVTILQGLGTPDEVVCEVPWNELARAVEPDHLTTLWVPRLSEQIAPEFVKLDELVRELRANVSWADQTHQTLTPFLSDQTAAVIAAISAISEDPEVGYQELEDALGEVLLQVHLHARLAAEDGRFTIAQVVQALLERLQES